MRISTPAQEGVLHISKCLKHQILIDEKEMAELLSCLSPCGLYIVSEPISIETAFVDTRLFLEKYALYMEALRQKKDIESVEKSLRPLFSSVLTKSPETLYAMPAGTGRFLIKPLKPIIQLQRHHFFLSPLDKKVHSMVFAKESIPWGLQFSYPHIYQDPRTRLIAKVTKGPDFPNTQLFTALSRWLRSQTIPVQLLYKGDKIYSSLRLGKNCLSWINSYLEGSDVHVYRNCHDRG